MNKFSNILITLGISLVLFSLLSFVFNNINDYKAGENSKEILKIMENNSDFQNENIVSEVVNLKEQEERVVKIKGNDYLGTIKIPTLNLNLPIMADFTYDNLNIAPCRYYGSLVTNDLIICGHSYQNHFRHIGSLKQGDVIIITDTYNKTYIYEVLEIEVLAADRVYEMINNDFDLTLFTCTLDSINRITVRCNLVS